LGCLWNFFLIKFTIKIVFVRIFLLLSSDEQHLEKEGNMLPINSNDLLFLESSNDFLYVILFWV